jgi:hypothetical protein
MSKYGTIDPLIEQAAKQLAENLKQTINRFVLLELYLIERFIRYKFPSWRKYYE